MKIKPRRRKRRKGGGFSWSTYWTTLISATVENAAPTHVVLTFAAGNTSVTADDFAVTGFTVASGSWTGAVFTLVLTSPVLIFDGDLSITFKLTNTGTVTNNVADDGNTIAWYDATDTAMRTLDGSDKFHIIWEKLAGRTTLGAEQDSGDLVVYGIYKITATQANFFYLGCQVGDVFSCSVVKTCDANNKVQRYTGNHMGTLSGNRPSLSADSAALFNGTDQKMHTAEFDYNQPEYIYILMRQITWTAARRLCDGNAASGGMLFNDTATPGIKANAGTSSPLNNDLSLNEWHVVRILFSGANSTLQIDAGAVTTGNFGANDMDGIAWGSSGSGSLYSNIEVKEAIYRTAAGAAGMDALIYDYLKKKG